MLDTSADDWGIAMAGALAAGPGSWVAACCALSPEDEGRPPEAILRLLGSDDPRLLQQDADALANAIRARLEPALRTALLSLRPPDPAITRHLLATWGLALHYRFAKDSGLAECWPHARAIADAWIDGPGGKEPSPRPISSENSRWLWRNIERTGIADPRPFLRTGIVVVDQDGEGHVAQLVVSLIETDALPAGVEALQGFVPAPGAMALVLDARFQDAFEAARAFARGLGVWEPGVAVEWDIEFMGQAEPSRRTGSPVIMLTGGSAGAAIGLATACLLSRRHREREQKKSTATPR